MNIVNFQSYVYTKLDIYYFQTEMSFEQFASLPYNRKLEKVNRAFCELSRRQIKVNRLLVVLREQKRMQEIFSKVNELNSILRSCVATFFDNTVPINHKHSNRKSTPKFLNELCTDTCHLLNYISNAPKTDAELDTLFVIGHSVKETQILFFQDYYVKYDWEKIFNSSAPVVLTPKRNYGYEMLSGKEVKQKFAEK